MGLPTLGRRAIYLLLPMPRTGTPPGNIINWTLVGVLALGLVLSLTRSQSHVAPAPSGQ